MTTCERRRTRAYGEDLRWRMVWQSLAQGYNYQTIARNLGVDASTVWRTVNTFNSTGTVNTKQYPKSRSYSKLSTPVELTIIHIVLSKPGIYLKEIQTDLYLCTGVELSVSCICKFLHKVGFTRQKMKLAAIGRDEALRSQFSADVSLYTSEMMIFLDETGSDRRDSLRKYGYSVRGKPILSQKNICRGKRISAIAIMSIEGMLDCMTTTDSVDSDVFYDFVEKYLLPHLMPFNGTNPHSIVIMDNCSIHHCDDIVHMIEQVGALVHFLPPYSPDYNPIEEAFSKVKTVMKEYEAASQVTDHETMVLSAFACITPEDCNQWIKDCKIYNT